MWWRMVRGSNPRHLAVLRLSRALPYLSTNHPDHVVMMAEGEGVEPFTDQGEHGFRDRFAAAGATLRIDAKGRALRYEREELLD